MNPILLKPQSQVGAQIVVQGRVHGTAKAAEYQGMKPQMLPFVLDSFARLKQDADLILVEGAGSASEINLRRYDIANMGFARAANVPVIIIGDIDRGGVIASLVGTKAVIDPDDAALVEGFIINKFRGDPALFADGYAAIEQRSQWRGFGVLPWVPAVAQLPSEDAVVLERGLGAAPGKLLVACPILPRIANFDDLDPLRQESGIEVAMIPPGMPIPQHAALIVLPGSKATIADLAALRAEGWDIDIKAHVRRGGRVLGLCGGYQMLGRDIADPHAVEGPPGEVPGLGLLDVTTVLGRRKALAQVEGTALGARFTGYEMHMGITQGLDTARPFAILGDDRRDGAIRTDGRVIGTYCHGLLAKPALRAALLERIGGRSDGFDNDARVDAALDDLAAQMETHLDIDGLLGLAGIGAGIGA
jgi:adenosylcobyric acid synthase